MAECSRCRAVLSDDDRFCSRCGAVQPAASESPTVAAATPAGAGWRGTTSGARFAPGSLLAGRYRILAPLGRGGMGEVWRADDLTLGTPVAVKVLATSVAASPGALDRLLDEVRHAREVSHPNVCRVHDIGEADGVHFLTMEYVDGENLAALLRRIGRLPSDKAVEIARQLCAGLAAAHDKGLLHRDLKPENVMLDGRGTVRITDFGLAVLAGRLRPDDLRSGTPAYMAPEQLEGREATVRSDLFSLGLVVHEMVTGRRVFDAKTPEEFDRQRRSFDPLTTTSGLEVIDPALERVVRRCLDPEPSRRPLSARAVAAALPGGDPLAAALEAGETPSPELVAAAGADRAISRRLACAALATFLACLVAAVALGSRHVILAEAAPIRSGEAFAERARDLVARVTGETALPRDEAHGFAGIDEGLLWLERWNDDPSRWDLLESRRFGSLAFWYRASPRPLKSWSPLGIVGPTNPPPFDVSGGVGVRFDEGGRLVSFLRVPPQVEEPLAEGVERRAEWGPLLESAGFARDGLEEAVPRWVPPVHADARAAWEASDPALPGIVFRIEAASYRGIPVYFQVVAPWARPSRMQEPEAPGHWDQVRTNANLILLLFGVGAAAVLAWRNARLGRGDQRGATRMALGLLAVFLVGWALRADHQFDLEEEWDLFLQGTAIGLFLAALVWLVYLALEPLVRRRIPHALISWTRLLSGSWRDPLVGRDVLLGAAAASASVLVVVLGRAIPAALGIDPGPPGLPDPETLRGARGTFGSLVGAPVQAVITPAFLLFLLAGLRQFLKRPWVAASVLGALLIPLFSGGPGGSVWVNTLLAATLVAIWVGTLARAGFLPLVVLILVFQWLVDAPWTLDPGAWWFPATVACAGAAVLLAVLGFWVAVAVRTVFDVFDDRG